MTTVVGIDPSMSGFAVAVSDARTVLIEEMKTKPAPTLRGRFARYAKLAGYASSIVYRHQPSLVLIEGYSYGAKGAATLSLAELGGVVRQRLLAHAMPVIEVPPSVLKKFATGRGNAGKAEVVSALSKRYDREFRTDNEADAFALAMLGLVAMGVVSHANEAQRVTALAVAEQISAWRTEAA